MVDYAKIINFSFQTVFLGDRKVLRGKDLAIIVMAKQRYRFIFVLLNFFI